MKKIMLASAMCVLMAIGFSQCKCACKLGANVLYKIQAVSERPGILFDTIKVQEKGNPFSYDWSIDMLDKINYTAESVDTVYFYLYAKNKLICDTGLVLYPGRVGVDIETDSTFMLKFTLRADSTLAVEQQLLTTTPQQSPVAVF